MIILASGSYLRQILLIVWFPEGALLLAYLKVSNLLKTDAFCRTVEIEIRCNYLFLWTHLSYDSLLVWMVDSV